MTGHDTGKVYEGLHLPSRFLIPSTGRACTRSVGVFLPPPQSQLLLLLLLSSFLLLQDDVVVMSESREELQELFDVVHEYRSDFGVKFNRE